MARKKTMKVGARVYHSTDETLDEGVVVHISTTPTNMNVLNGSPYSVHWSCGKKGNYSIKEIARIPTSTTIKQIQKEVSEDGEE